VNQERWQHIEKLYHAALERDPAGRATFLQQACAGDEELHREVESLLAHGERTGSFLEAPAIEAAAKVMGKEQGVSLIGRQLGSYHVLAKIGAGGMGEVYLAKDMKLKREVALKVLPPAMARDPERVARFRREAQLLASLNHKHIAAIYGFEESPEANFLVLELVEGDTLAERIARAGPLPVSEALGIAQQIAEALEYAHKKAVTHRDIKPANVKLTPEGEVKVLDFGLAKVFEGDEAGVDLSELPTLSAAPTKEGQILGTPAYMSPGQVRGKAVDKRTDIWAFGCVLYELLTGRRAFQGETLSDTLAAVLEREPNWQALPPATPERVRELLQRCLEKDVNRRRRDMGDIHNELEQITRIPGKTEPVALVAVAPKKNWRRRLLWAASGLAALALVPATLWYLRPEPPQQVMRLSMNVSPAEQLVGLT